MKKILFLALSTFFSLSIFATETPEPCKTTKYVYKVKTRGNYQAGSGGQGNGGPICHHNPNAICVLIRTEVPDVFAPANITFAEWYNPDTNTYESISSIVRIPMANGTYKLNFTYGPTWTGPFGLLPTQYTVEPE